jgi:hypothetical protein
MKLILEKWRKYLGEKVFADYSGGKKGVWVDLAASDLADHGVNVDITDELYDMIDKSYAAIGGNVDIRSPADVPSDYDKWIAIDVDDDPEPDAVRAARSKPSGIKMTLGATDGGSAAKEAYIKKTADLLRTPGNYGEMSDAAAHIMIKYHNAPFVDNEEDVRKVLGKDIEWVGAHPSGKYPNHTGWYTRRLGKDSKAHLKILLGMPNGASVAQP